ncbi:MAG: ribbon-helix-helix protein, CopG family [Candidatus Dadabacteria bacterium]|nr:ribbon-helix-helix protein, CopG family [Candidatus Dadabacteria bacterium]
MANISLRLPDEMLKELKRVAEETERSKSYHIKKAIEAYLEDYADHAIALKRLSDPTDKLITSEELRKKLGI